VPPDPGPRNPGAILYYRADAFSADTHTAMGRHVAGATFLEAYCRHASAERFYGLTRTDADFAAFVRQLAGFGIAPERIRRHRWRTMGDFAEPGTLFRFDPDLAGFAAQRQRRAARGFALVGITHSMSTKRSWKAVGELVTAPLQPWDAVICTSAAGKAVVDTLLDMAEGYLAARLGASRFVRPERPVIPLGVDAPSFAPDPAARAAWRARLGVGPDDVLAVFLGRLSVHAKANPFAHLAAVAEAQRRTTRRIHLVLAGRAYKAAIRDAFAAAIRRHDAGGPVHLLDDLSETDKRGLLSAADLYLSFADSIQETFGIAPVEAMAAGLPCVVSDWNGYRDTVRDGLDGFRVPTLTPGAPAGGRLAEMLALDEWDYDHYCALTSQMTAVDIRAAAAGIAALAEAPERRRAMGESARRRALETFDWSRIIPAYEALWGHLASVRAAADPAHGHEPPPLESPDPFRLFATFPTRRLDLDDEVRALTADARALARAARSDPLFDHAFAVLSDAETIDAMLTTVAARPTTVRALIVPVPSAHRAAALRSIVWLAKRGLVAVRSPRSGPDASKGGTDAAPAGTPALPAA